MISRSNTLIAIAVAVLTFSLWAYLNRPEQEPVWPSRIQGFSFMPMRPGQSPLVNKFPSEAQVSEDLALLSGKTHAVRTYSTEGVLSKIPDLARPYRINVALGAWIDARLENNEKEIRGLLEVARTHRNVVRVIVGNEVVLRADIPIADLIAYLRRVRGELKVPVSTAEPWHVWINILNWPKTSISWRCTCSPIGRESTRTSPWTIS